MAKMLELIEQKAVPENVLESAAQGKLSLPAEEMIEILVHLSRDAKFGGQARETLQQWDVETIASAVSRPSISPDTVKWVLGPANPRASVVLSRLVKRSATGGDKGLEAVIGNCPAAVVPALLTLEHVRSSETLLRKLLTNPGLQPAVAAQVRSHIAQIHAAAKPAVKTETKSDPASGVKAEAKTETKPEAKSDVKPDIKMPDVKTEEEKAEKAEIKAEAEPQVKPEAKTTEAKPETPEPVESEAAKPEAAKEHKPGVEVDEKQLEEETTAWIKQHAAEIAAEEGTEFALVGGLDGDDESGEVKKVDLETLAASVKKGVIDPSRLSTIQKLARMPVSLRIQQAMKGTREERGILIRDSSRLVCLAVLASPKLSLQEVEGFASMKNIRDEVLRELVRNRKFRKNYVVMRNLCNNAKTPLDLTLTLINDLLVNDLRGVAMNKNVPDTIRKVAQRKLQEKVSGRKS